MNPPYIKLKIFTFAIFVMLGTNGLICSTTRPFGDTIHIVRVSQTRQRVCLPDSGFFSARYSEAALSFQTSHKSNVYDSKNCRSLPKAPPGLKLYKIPKKGPIFDRRIILPAYLTFSLCLVLGRGH